MRTTCSARTHSRGEHPQSPTRSEIFAGLPFKLKGRAFVSSRRYTQSVRARGRAGRRVSLALGISMSDLEILRSLSGPKVPIG